MFEIGKNARLQREVFTISITRFSQTDSAWMNDIMQTKGDTIGESGCYLTSFAMVANYFKPSAGYNPKTINILIGNAACPFYRETAGDRAGLEILNYCQGTSAIYNLNDFVSGSMVMDRPVIIGLIKSNGETHYVVARGYSVTTEEIYILDPGSSSTNTLSTYLNTGWSVNELLAYAEP